MTCRGRSDRQPRQQDRSSAIECAQLLESIARSVRSGLSLSAALDHAIGFQPARVGTARGDGTRVDDRIIEAVRRHRRGEGLAQSLDAVRDACRDDEDVRLTVAVLWIAAGHGGPSAEALDRAAATLRDHAALAADARTHAAPARLSATVLTLSPIVFSGLAAVADQDVRRVLVSTPAGWICLAAGLALALGGRRWMNQLVRTVS